MRFPEWNNPRILVLALGLLAGSAIGPAVGWATGAVAVLEAEAGVEHWVVYDGNHGPCAHTGFSHPAGGDVSFDLQAPINEDSCVTSVWNASCDAYGFRYSGQIDEVTEGFYRWLTHVEARITVILEVMTETRITATRTVSGSPSNTWHTVMLTLPDDSEDVMLGADPSVNNAERLLEPGTHRVTFSLYSEASEAAPFAYAGLVEVRWESPVAVEGRTWGGIKSLYR